MGTHDPQKELFSYQVDLDRRVRAGHPLRAVRAAVDFSFVRTEVARFYGGNGHVSVDPAVILKLMFLLFFDDVRSERELLRMLPERLDYLWFLDFGLDAAIPDHSVLSKARARWGQEVFEQLFVRTVSQCVDAGLVDGRKLHLDGSLVTAHASRESVVKSTPELIAALKAAYAQQAAKLTEPGPTPDERLVNARLVSTTDPDAAGVRSRTDSSRPRYKHHRAVDDRCGVITAVETTPGDVMENHRAATLVEQHERLTGHAVQIVVADRQYGTAENYRTFQQRGLTTHLAPLQQGPSYAEQGLFRHAQFRYDPAADAYTCPAGQTLPAVSRDATVRTTRYQTAAGVCPACPLRAQCTRAQHGRTLRRHDDYDWIARGWAQARSAAGRRDLRRRRYLMEGSFAQAANLHHFKRARWRRLWRQQIQDWLIAAVQNIKLWLRHAHRKPALAQATTFPAALSFIAQFSVRVQSSCGPWFEALPHAFT
jgi:transposase